MDAFRSADEVLLNGVQGITDLITTPGLINVDFADVKSVMAGAGTALMGIGSARGEGRAVQAAEKAINSPLLEASMDGAHGVLLSIAGGSDLGLFEINEAASLVQEAAHEEANIIFGTVIDDSLGDEVRVTVIAAGFDSGAPDAQEAGPTAFRSPAAAGAEAARPPAVRRGRTGPPRRQPSDADRPAATARPARPPHAAPSGRRTPATSGARPSAAAAGADGADRPADAGDADGPTAACAAPSAPYAAPRRRPRAGHRRDGAGRCRMVVRPGGTRRAPRRPGGARRRRGRPAVHEALTSRPRRCRGPGDRAPCESWARATGVVTTRAGGRSTRPVRSFNLAPRVGDDPAAVAANRERLSARAGPGAGGVAASRCTARPSRSSTRAAPAEARTSRRRRAGHRPRRGRRWRCWSPTACRCCSPTRRPGWSAAAHAGRVGAAAGVLPATVAAMAGSARGRARIEVLLGPAICGALLRGARRPCATRSRRPLPGSAVRTRPGTPGLDLRAGLDRQLAGLGVGQGRRRPAVHVRGPGPLQPPPEPGHRPAGRP